MLSSPCCWGAEQLACSHISNPGSSTMWPQKSIMSCDWLTIDWVWIGNWIYWTLTKCNYKLLWQSHWVEIENGILGVESNWVHLALRPPRGLLCQPWVIMMMEKLVEWWLAGETEVLGENLPQCRFVHHKPHMLCLDANPGCHGGKPATNCLSYGTACFTDLHTPKITVTTALVKSSQSSLAAAWLWLPTADIPLPLRCQPVPVLQLPASPQQSSNSLTHSVTQNLVATLLVYPLA
jgi:hypothetical protein